MLDTMKNKWGLVAMNGLAMVGFGVGTLLFPIASLAVLILILGVFLLVDGGYRAVMAFIDRKQDERWWVGLLNGIISFVAGVTVMALPGMTMVWLYILLAVWMIMTGGVDLWQAIREREGRGWHIAGGLAGVALGAMLFAAPLFSTLGLMWMVGLYAIVIGLVRFALSLELRFMKNVERSGMLSTLLRDARWMLIVNGLLAIGLGAAVFAWPALTLTVFITLFGLYALFGGLVTASTAIIERQSYTQWGWLLAEGLVNIGIGIAAFAWTDITLLALVLLVAARALLVGIIEVVMAVRLRKEIEGEWLLGAMGVGFIILGMLIAVWPGIALQTMFWLVGGSSIVIGIAQIAFSFHIGSLGKETDKRFAPAISAD